MNSIIFDSIEKAETGDRESELSTVFQVCKAIATNYTIVPNSDRESQDQEILYGTNDGMCTREEMVELLYDVLTQKGINSRTAYGITDKGDNVKYNIFMICGKSYAIDLATTSREIKEQGELENFGETLKESCAEYGLSEPTQFQSLALKYGIYVEEIKNANDYFTHFNKIKKDKDKDKDQSRD